MPRPHAASIVGDAWNRRLGHVLQRRGWQPKIIPFSGYGTVGFVRVMARVLLSRDGIRAAELLERMERGELPTVAQLRDAQDERGGWRAFFAAPAMDLPVTITVNDQSIAARTDRAGLLDVTVRGHGLAPGWHQVAISVAGAETVEASILVIGSSQTFGIISDIDDTVLSTSLPRPMIAAWNTFVKAEATRRAVPGMATMIRDLLAEHPGAPLVYVSTGAWNTAPFLTRFLRRNGFPSAPMLLTDWGPTSTGWFRSGREHKKACLHRLARELPHIQWLLVGDDGQHDPAIYGDFAEQRPDIVRAIAIRQLSTTEQVLSHMLPVANEDLVPKRRRVGQVPICRASDGWGLARLLRTALGEDPPLPEDGLDLPESIEVRTDVPEVDTDA